MKIIPSIAIATLLLFNLGVAGCDVNDDPVERAGESVDDAIDDTGDALEDAGDEIQDTMD